MAVYKVRLKEGLSKEEVDLDRVYTEVRKLYDNLGMSPEVAIQMSNSEKVVNEVVSLLMKYRDYAMPHSRDEYIDAIAAAQDLFDPEWVWDIYIDCGGDPDSETIDSPGLNYEDMFDYMRIALRKKVKLNGYDQIPTRIINEFGL